MKKYLFNLLAISIVTFLCNTSYADNYYNAQQLATLLGNTNTIASSFQEKVYNAQGKLLQSTSGTMAMQRPNKFRWDITSPTKQLMVADGKNLWMYNKSLQQVTVEPLRKNLASTPALLLNAKASEIDFYFKVINNNGNFTLQAKSNSNLFQKIELQFSDGHLKEMHMLDNLGQTGDLKFSSLRINPQLVASTFQFSVPQGVDVIGKPS